VWNDDGDGFADVGETITYNFTVTNNGNVTLTNVTLADTVGGVTLSGGPIATLAVGASDTTTFTATYTITQEDIDAGTFYNVATATGTDPNGDDTSDEGDNDEPLVQNPSIDIVKTFTDDTVTAGGTGSSFTLVVINNGNVTLSDALIGDTVDSRLEVTGVSGTAGADADTDGNAQTVEWLIANLGVGETVTITVDFVVDASVEEANGVGGLNDEDRVQNLASVAAEGPQGDVSATDDDTIGIVVEIDLSIVKTFDPANVPQGSTQTFTIAVSNAGPSDAVDVAITDTVNSSLVVTGVTLLGGDCSASTGQQVDCTVDIPAGQTATVTVTYVASPFLPEGPDFGGHDGSEFRFVFVNGYVLEGAAETGATLYDETGAVVETYESDTKNDFLFDPPGADPEFLMHLSCSDPFTDGWGSTAGPVEGVDVNWQIAFFSINRYKKGDFFRSCGDTVNSFNVDNTATVAWADSAGSHEVADDATVTIDAGGPGESGVEVVSTKVKNRQIDIGLANGSGEDRVITEVTVDWPRASGNLRAIRLDGSSLWLGNVNSSPLTISSGDFTGSVFARTLQAGATETFRLSFSKRVASSGHSITITFDDGTSVSIAI
jgi:uncharacterized repeat protein (TIGR01451 family)